MSDVIGRAVIEVSADSTKLSAGMSEAKRSVTNLGATIGTAVADGSAKASRSIDAYIKKLEQSASTIGMSTSQIKLMELAQRGATETQLKAADAAFRTLDAYKAQATEARKAAAAAAAGAAIANAAQATQATSYKLTAHQSQQLSFQLNDLFVQIASGQSPVTALIQQGSQLNGTFGGLGGTMRAVGTLFTATRVLVGGTAGAFAALGYAAMEGHKQSADFAKAIALTGNAAGVTEGQFNSMAMSIGESTKTSVGSARDALQGLVASGRFSGDALSETAKATQLLSKATGQSTDDIIKQFVGMSDGVGKWAETTNKGYHFLNASQLEYIKTLEEQGSQQKAIEVVMGALNSRLGEASKNVGVLESAWNGVARAAKNALDTMLSIGRTNTADDQIAQLQKKIEFTNKSAGGLTGMSATALAAFNKGAQAELAALQATKAAQDDVAKGSERAIAQEQARIKFDTLREQSLSKQEKMTKELAAANAVADKAGISEVDRAKVLANIRDKYKEAKGPASKAPQEAKATLTYDLDAIKKASAAEIDIYTNADKIMEAKRSAGLIEERAYYAEKLAFIQLNSQAQEAALLKEIERMQAEKLIGKDKTDNDRKIMDAQAQLAKVRTDAATNIEINGIQQKSAMEQVKRSFEEARIAAQAYLDTLGRQQDREVEAFDKGDKERNRLGGRQQIEDKYTQQRLDLDRDKRLLEMDNKFNPESREKYEKQLALIDEYQAKALVKWDAGYKAIGEKEADWSTGARRSMENYLDSATNVSMQTQGLFNNAFQGMEDAMVQFTMTGKLSFGDLAKSIIADLARIQAKNLMASLIGGSGQGALGGGLGGLFAKWGTMAGAGGSSSATGGMGIMGDVIGLAGARAAGGPVDGGSSYLVGEKEAETFKPSVFGIAVLTFSMPKQGSLVVKGAGKPIPKTEAINKPEGLHEFACV
jgi:lambda family phage tail tape measure protein